jgi:chemotaxis response regulator CheB
MRIGIVNDMILTAEILRRIILRAGVHDVAWIAHDGADAVTRCERDKPDMILMDLFMPKLDGVQAIKQIMAATPCAIIVASNNVEHHTAKVFEAMGAGALDAVSIPTYTDVDHVEDARALLAKIDKINRLVGEPQSFRKRRTEAKSQKSAERSSNAAQPPSPGIHRAHKLIAIGSSAGGPAALTTILAALPRNFQASVVIVQHVDKQFAQGLTAWFTSHSKLEVRVAHEGDRLEPGIVYLAGQDRHLVMFSPTQIGYTSQPIESSYCPSVDVFFKSVAKFWRGESVGVLLTGMGRDGAEGLKAMRDAGHHTIAQDKGSSAIYGMPKAAAELDAAKEILALDKIGQRLTTLTTKR